MQRHIMQARHVVGTESPEPRHRRLRHEDPSAGAKQRKHCALYQALPRDASATRPDRAANRHLVAPLVAASEQQVRSEERRVGKEGRSRWSPYHLNKLRLEDSSGKLGGSNFSWVFTKPETLTLAISYFCWLSTKPQPRDWAKTTGWITLFQAEDGIRDA